MTQPDKDLAAIISHLIPLVEEQSCGEWGDELVAEDAAKIAAGLAPHFVTRTHAEAECNFLQAKLEALREISSRPDESPLKKRMRELQEVRDAVAAEREACALIADYAGVKQMPSDGSYSHHEPVMGPDVAETIRARGQK